MSAVPLARQDLADRSRSLVGWGVGIMAYAGLMLALYPSVRDSEAFAAAVEDYPDVLQEFLGGAGALDITSGPGFLQAEVFGLVLPLLLTVAAIGVGARLATDQRSGLLDLVMANPVRRRQLVAERALVLVAVVVVLTACAGVVIGLLSGPVDLSVGGIELLAALVATAVLAAFHGAVALLIAARTGDRTLAITGASGVFTVGYVVAGLGGIIDWLEPGRRVSPHHLTVGGLPLRDGFELGVLGVAAAAAALVWLALEAFERRDLL
ncbi:MAG: ABC transporter permease subunit [Actinomycetota bacterium]